MIDRRNANLKPLLPTWETSEQAPPLSELKSDTPIPEKAKVLHYMKNAQVATASPGIAVDIFTGERMGVSLISLWDDYYHWSSCDIYYFEKYNFKLPDDFVDYAIKFKPTVESYLRKKMY